MQPRHDEYESSRCRRGGIPSGSSPVENRSCIRADCCEEDRLPTESVFYSMTQFCAEQAQFVQSSLNSMPYCSIFFRSVGRVIPRI